MSADDRGYARREFAADGFLPVVKRWWWLLLLCAAVAGASGYAAASRSTPTYESRVELLVGPISGDIEVLRASGLLAHTYAELATSRPVRDAVKKRLAIERTGGSVSASANEVTRILKITVVHPDRVRGPRIANAIAAELKRLAASSPRPALPPGSAPGTPPPPNPGEVRIVESAKASSARVGSGPRTIAPLAAIAGLLVGLGLAVLLERGSGRITHEDDLAELADAPVLGSVSLPHRSPKLEAASGSEEEKQFALLAAKLALAERPDSARSLVVAGASSSAGDGRLAANVASALAASGTRVTLVDLNEDDEITRAYGLEGRAGANDLLDKPEQFWAGPNPLDRYLVAHGRRLQILPRGAVNGSRAVEAEHARLLLSRLLADADVVLLNAPAIQRSPSTLVWARVVDGTILVARRNRSSRADVEAAVAGLALVGGRLVGTVLSRRPARRSR